MLDAVPYSSESILETREICTPPKQTMQNSVSHLAAASNKAKSRDARTWSRGGMIREIMLVPFLRESQAHASSVPSLFPSRTP